ncbi:alpha-galactosidase [Microbacterium bovistercoris]|uniref:Alpha-galactosidase n=1 Tax=Microbacterium bovistercoris TaxID=2293570 RepID=A0A371NY44_9MICO|nr:alpha-galactosidase [Microbacterium bovistercoris]
MSVVEDREEILAHALGPTELRYVRQSGIVGLEIVPAARSRDRRPRRSRIDDVPAVDALPFGGELPAGRIDPLVTLQLRGDSASGMFTQGRSTRWAPAGSRFTLLEQTASLDAVSTVLRSPDGLQIVHRVELVAGGALVFRCTVENLSEEPVVIEALSSFCLSAITPFARDDASGRLVLHRMRSAWSAEGRLVSESLEDLHLERSWLGVAGMSERFGQVGSMPVRGWMPFVAVEDRAAGVTWGAQLAWGGSWQLEVARLGDDVALAGGLADREFGHWTKMIAPGQSLTSPDAIVAVVSGGVDELHDALLEAQDGSAGDAPGEEADLPIVVNEWCSSWGNPSHESLVALADRLVGSGVRYLVIDAGWFRPEGEKDWARAHGDWIPNTEQFPSGLKGVADALRERGLIPGLWFELETVGSDSMAYQCVDRLLHRDGVPLTVGSRRFWNLARPEVVDHLVDTAVELLEGAGFGYLKIDYNETIGLGSDHADGLGEGLRQQILGSHRLLRRIQDRMPDLVVENCASGGHRLEPSFVGRTAMTSCSDAHEVVEIPIIAAEVQRVILPRQAQVWAVIHAEDSPDRLTYSLAAGFLGRLCLSGALTDLGEEQWALVRRAIHLYRKTTPILKRGTSRRFGQRGHSWRRPEGWQAVRRLSDDGRRALIVLHSFRNAPNRAEVPLEGGGWSVAGVLRSTGGDVSVASDGVSFEDLVDFEGVVVELIRGC